MSKNYPELSEKIEIMLKNGKTNVAGFDLGEGMMRMLGSMTVLRLTGMLGMMDVSFSKEELIALNKELNDISKE